MTTLLIASGERSEGFGAQMILTLPHDKRLLADGSFGDMSYGQPVWVSAITQKERYGVVHGSVLTGRMIVAVRNDRKRGGPPYIMGWWKDGTWTKVGVNISAVEMDKLGSVSESQSEQSHTGHENPVTCSGNWGTDYLYLYLIELGREEDAMKVAVFPAFKELALSSKVFNSDSMQALRSKWQSFVGQVKRLKALENRVALIANSDSQVVQYGAEAMLYITGSAVHNEQMLVGVRSQVEASFSSFSDINTESVGGFLQALGDQFDYPVVDYDRWESRLLALIDVLTLKTGLSKVAADSSKMSVKKGFSSKVSLVQFLVKTGMSLAAARANAEAALANGLGVLSDGTFYAEELKVFELLFAATAVQEGAVQWTVGSSKFRKVMPDELNRGIKDDREKKSVWMVIN